MCCAVYGLDTRRIKARFKRVPEVVIHLKGDTQASLTTDAQHLSTAWSF